MENTKEMTLQEIQEKLGCKIKIVDEKTKVKLSDIEIGKPFKVGYLEFVVLEHFPKTTAVILKDFWKKASFDSNSNDYRSSDIRKDLNTDFYNQLAEIVGKENIIKHTVDLTSDDGRKEYETCMDYISLLTYDQYRKYVSILDKYNPKQWWWLATPYSTLKDYRLLVRCVYDNGALFNDYCSNVSGVRPFCILKSNIFVSE